MKTKLLELTRLQNNLESLYQITTERSDEEGILDRALKEVDDLIQQTEEQDER